MKKSNKERKEKKVERKLTKKQKIIISITIFVVIIIGIIVGVIVSNSKETGSGVMHRLTNDFEPIISKNEDGSYRIFGADRNQKFEVEAEENFEYKITDEEGKEVSTTTVKNENKVTINAPKDLYDEGKDYKLVIKNGTFVDNELKEVKEVTFSIKRNASNSYRLKDDIKEVNENDIKVSDNLLTSSTEYKKDDIIVVKDNDNIKAYYKVEEPKEGNTYQVSVPDLNEVYDEFDFYGVETVDLSNFETDENLKEYIAYEVKKSVLDYLVEEVDAKIKIEIKDPFFNVKTGKLELTIKISSEAGDRVFGNKFLDNHDMSMELKASIRLDAYNDIKLGIKTSFDTGIKICVELSPKVTLEHRDEEIRKFRKDIKETLKQDTSKWNTSWLNNKYKDLKEDHLEYKPELGKLAVPTGAPGVYASLTTGLLFKFDLKASLEANIATYIEVGFGVRMNSGKKDGIYAIYKSSGNMTGSFAGEVKTELGLKTSAGVEVANVIMLKGTLSSGLYTDAKWTLKTKAKNVKKEEAVTTLESKLEGGLFVKFEVEAKVPGFEGSKKFYDDKLKLIDEKSSFELGKLSNEDAPVSKEENKPNNSNDNNNNNDNNNSNNNNNNTTPTYRYTKEEVKAKLLAGFKKFGAGDSYWPYEVNPFGCSGDACFVYADGGVWNVWGHAWSISLNNNTITYQRGVGYPTSICSGPTEGENGWNASCAQVYKTWYTYPCTYNYVTGKSSCNLSSYRSGIRYSCGQWEYPLEESFNGEPTPINNATECYNYYNETGLSNDRMKKRFNDILSYTDGLTLNDLEVLK